jgi:hypothetical protein
MIEFEESGMLFAFNEEHVFRIEQSALYNPIKGKGIKVVECITCAKENALYFIEAKASSPIETDKFIGDISQKFLDSFDMYLAAFLKRKKCNEISKSLMQVSIEKAKFTFVLIIKKHKPEWSALLQGGVEKNLIRHRKIWGSSIVVLNEEKATEKGFVKKR